MLNNKKNQGFSLIEILVVMMILLLISVISADFIIKGLRSTTYESEMQTAIQHARTAVNIMSKEIRGANKSEMGHYPILTAQEDNLAFFSDINNNNQMEKIQYYLNGTNLIKEITPAGPANDYNMPTETIIISRYVNNREVPIFTYYDNNYEETEAINRIRLINIVLRINVKPERAPYNYHLETDVNLRNLKDNL